MKCISGTDPESYDSDKDGRTMQQIKNLSNTTPRSETQRGAGLCLIIKLQPLDKLIDEDGVRFTMHLSTTKMTTAMPTHPDGDEISLGNRSKYHHHGKFRRRDASGEYRPRRKVEEGKQFYMGNAIPMK